MKQEVNIESLEVIVGSIVDHQSLHIACAKVLYRINKCVKYIQLEQSGFVHEFYAVKRTYIDYFTRNGFRVECKNKDSLATCFYVYGVPLVFHPKNGRKRHMITNVDISNVTDEVKYYIEDSKKMYKLLIKFLEMLGVDDKNRAIALNTKFNYQNN